eukprot:SAG31_NODE_1155_length_9624_cov_3.380157_8_plen_92_part_00
MKTRMGTFQLKILVLSPTEWARCSLLPQFGLKRSFVTTPTLGTAGRHIASRVELYAHHVLIEPMHGLPCFATGRWKNLPHTLALIRWPNHS